MDRRRALMMAGSGTTPRLPATYQEVEWIGYSDSKQYLYTGILASNTVKVIADIAKLTVPSNGTVFPNATSSKGWGTIENISGSKWTCSPSISRTTLFNRTTFTSTKDSVSGTEEVRIGYSTASYCPSLQYYTLKVIGANDALLFDGVPCYRKSNGEIGMYDLVSSSFIAAIHDGVTNYWRKGPDVS